MAGISFLEFVVVLLAVVIFVKPEDMPRFFRRIGQYYAQIQHYIRRVRSYTADTFDEISRLDLDADRRTALRPPPPAPPPPLYGQVARDTARPSPDSPATTDQSAPPKATDQDGPADPRQR